MNAESHRDAAMQLLADVNETAEVSEAHVLAQAAIAHALLGLLEIQMAAPVPLYRTGMSTLSNALESRFKPQGD